MPLSASRRRPWPTWSSGAPRTRMQNIAGYQRESINGAARNYQELSAPSAITATTAQADGQAVRFCAVSA
jgi:hypothetical protein